MSRCEPLNRRRLSTTLVAALLVAACGSESSSGAPAASDAEAPGTRSAAVDSTADTGPATPTPSDADEGPVATDGAIDPVTTASPTTSQAPVEPTEPSPTVGGRTCARIAEFDDADAAGWVVVNDGVMGGRSLGEVEFDGSTMRFTGTVVTAGGGFTSVRLPLDGELAGTSNVTLRIRPDERVYGLTFESDVLLGRRSVSYGADVPADQPADPEGFQTVTVGYDDLEPTVFGTPVDAPPFDPDAGSELGIIIADGIDGDFALEVDWIDACV